jgi:hypothetical protein
VLLAWGPGKFDAELLLDGKGFRPDGKTAATLIPPAFGLAGVNLHTFTGLGSVTYWNAFVGNLDMHGKGTFFDPRLNDAAQFPVAAAHGFGNVRSTPDLITSKLGDLQFYELAIPAPVPPHGTFDEDAAALGKDLFDGPARCARCHVPPLFTEPDGICAHPRKLESTIFRRTGHRTNAIGRLPLKRFGRTRSVVFSTMGALQHLTA